MLTCYVTIYIYIYTTLCVLRVCINSDTSLEVVLWGEQATSFLAKQLQEAGQESPQIVIFIDTLVRGYAGMYISP
jgi:hypothetical protein